MLKISKTPKGRKVSLDEKRIAWGRTEQEALARAEKKVPKIDLAPDNHSFHSKA